MEIVIVGSGYGGLRAALDLDRRLYGRQGTSIVLMDRFPYHQLTTELHKAAAGTAPADEMRIPLAELLRGTKVRFKQGAIQQIHAKKHEIELDTGKVLGFDKLVLAVGSEIETFGIPGVEEHSYAIWTLSEARQTKEHIDAMFERAGRLDTPAEREEYVRVVVGGGGLTGVEFLGELTARMPVLADRYDVPRRDVRILAVEALPNILAGFDEGLVEKAKRVLGGRGVEFCLGVPVTKVDETGIELKTGERIKTKTFVWTGGVRGHRLVESAFTVDRRGRAIVNEFLQSVDDPDIFVIGDCALAVNPKTGVPVAPTSQNAIVHGRLVARNIAASLDGRPLTSYDAKTLGYIASLGPGEGIAQLGRWKLVGPYAATLKELSFLRYLHSIGGPRLVWRHRLGRERRSLGEPLRHH